MKNKAVNSLGYSGIVTLSRNTNNKKVKIVTINNSGSYSLFNFLSDCLLGDFETAKPNRPTKIMLLSTVNNDDGSKNYRSESGYIYLVSKAEKVYDPSNGIVRYSFVIPRDMLKNVSFDSIGLYSNSAGDQDINNFAAVVNLDDEHKNRINVSLSTASALVLDWELTISNKEGE